MNATVLLFFGYTTLATLFLGYRFWSSNNKTLKWFGMGLFLNGVAFAIWSTAVLQHSANLDTWVTAGSLFLALALVAFFKASANVFGENSTFFGLGVIYTIVLFVTRTFVYPSTPSFSPEGLLFFNVQPVVQAMYILAFVWAVFPVFNYMAEKVYQGTTGEIVRYGFIVVVMGSVLLIVSTDPALVNIAGWAIGLAYLSILLTAGKKVV